MGIKDELVGYDDEEIQKPSGGERLPDGKYQTVVHEARVEHSKGTGRLQFTIVMFVTNGDHTGRVITKCTGLDTPERRQWAGQDVMRMGIDIERISQLPAICPLLVDLNLEVTLKSKEYEGTTYQNVFINRVLIPEDSIETSDILDELSDEY